MAVNPQKIKRKTLSGVSVLILRNLFMQPISFLGFVFLSVFLKRWELGVFWAVSEIVGFLGYFSDIGLAAAVIQKKEKPTKEELREIFTIQQVLVVSSIIVALLLTPWLENKFDFENGRFLYRMLLFGFFAASLKTIPSVLLERKLRFEKIATVDLVEQIIFTGLAVILAWKGQGVNSWAWAVFFRSLVGVVLIYVFSSWPVGISFHFGAVKKLFSFGIPFQLNSLLAMAKDRLVNIFLWGILGSEGVGILGWAQRWAQMPLRFLMDAVIRVTFPAYSRLQNEKDRLRRALERSGFAINFLLLPVLTGMGFLMPKAVVVFPQYRKWAVGILPFWFYLGNFAWGVVTTPLVNAFNSVGKVKITLRLMVLWTVLTWVFTPLLAREFGVNGAACGFFLVSATSFVAWILARKEFAISLRRILFTPILGNVVMLFFLLALDWLTTQGRGELILLTIAGAGVYFLVMFLIAKEEISWFIETLLEWVKSLRK